MYCSPDKGQHYTVLSGREDISSTKLKLNKQKIIKHTSNLNLQGRRSFGHTGIFKLFLCSTCTIPFLGLS